MQRLCRLILMLVVLLLIGAYIQKPEYIIYSIISGSGGDTRDTELFVIVYQSWDTDGTVTEIVRKHCTMNGTPNRLTIHLYHSKYALNHGQAYYTKIFEYSEDEIIGPPPAW